MWWRAHSRRLLSGALANLFRPDAIGLTVSADCDDCSFATISSLEIDGNRPQLLRIKKGDALIETGNGEGQVVRDCRLYEPR